MEVERRSGRLPRQRGSEMQPDGVGGRLALAGEDPFLREVADLPLFAVDLSGEQGNKLGELEEGTTIEMSGEDNFADNLLCASPGFPGGLALANDPAGLGGVDGGQGRGCPAGREKKAGAGQPEPTESPADACEVQAVPSHLVGVKGSRGRPVETKWHERQGT